MLAKRKPTSQALMVTEMKPEKKLPSVRLVFSSFCKAIPWNQDWPMEYIQSGNNPTKRRQTV